MLISILIKSTTYIPNKFTTFATQKNSPLTITPDNPEPYICSKASVTNELYPARNITINPIKVGNP
jgi:hypothetical protein